METDPLHRLWKALSDPSRRRILDLLRERPRTTGDLAQAFDFTRFATMKHLRVLEEAELVSVRRRGRERWNHLNAVPLQRLYERWIRPFEAQWASRLLNLEHVVTSPGGNAMPQPTPDRSPLDLIVIEQEIGLAAPPARVFEALLGDISPWWGRPYVQNHERVQSITIEPRLGGRFLEQWSDGEGAIWATVTTLRRNERLILTGSMAMGGAVHGTMRFDLLAREDATILEFSHHAMGEVTEEMRQSYGVGWKDLLGHRLKTWVEQDQRLGLGHEPPLPAS
jgi:DNA-binding transcriptional ArsR family regulator/uncharacterized protein YndB with AHSA1/START domain